MIKTVFSAALPMGESLVVCKNRIVGARKAGPRIAVVTGMHGDELAGQFVTFELARRLRERPGDLLGVVDIYPALNPLGLSSREHGVPQFDIDLDRTFPGNADGNLTEALAAAVLDDIRGASVCFVIHSSDSFVQELTQARIDEADPNALVRIASQLNVRLVWVREPSAPLDSTLAHALNERGTPTLAIKMGSDVRVAENEASWLVEGILRTLEHLKAWSGPTILLPQPRVSDGSDVITLLSEEPGLFSPRVDHGSEVQPGQSIGIVVDALEGTVRHEVRSPCAGLLFALRTYPVVYPGSLVARVLEAPR